MIVLSLGQHRPGNPRQSRPRGTTKPGEFGLAGNWAGAVVQVASLKLSPAEPANTVFAEWKVPAIDTKTTEPGTQIVGHLGGPRRLQHR